MASIQGYAFARSGEGVTKRLRSKAFRALLRQEIAYFDQSEHSSGALCTRLATEASAAQGASGVRFGLIIENLFAMSVGILIGLAYSWQLTLLVVAFLPLVLFGGILQIRLTTRFARRNRHIVEDAGKVRRSIHRLNDEFISRLDHDGSYSEYSNGNAIDQTESLRRSIFSKTQYYLSVLSDLYVSKIGMFVLDHHANIFKL